jgi:hypothetical protein
VGKTSVVAALISALPDFSWTAVKITQHGHGLGSGNGAVCDGASAKYSWSIYEERDRSDESDTSRFLVAGAVRALLVQAEPDRLAEAMLALRARIANAANVIIESNSVLNFLRPDLYLMVLDPANADFKDSAREFFDRADAVILDESSGGPAWQGVVLNPVAGRPVFRIKPPNYVTPELVDFVRLRLSAPLAAENSRNVKPDN